MPDNAFWTLIAPIAGAVAVFAGATIAALAQRSVAKVNSDKDILLHRERLSDERFKAELATERENLDLLHRTLSKIELENSQTMSYIQSDGELAIADFRTRYLENCDRLHAAMAISTIHYPVMTKGLREVYTEANIFWGYQESLLQTSFKENPAGAQTALGKVLDAGKSIRRTVSTLQDVIERRADALRQRLAETDIGAAQSRLP